MSAEQAKPSSNGLHVLVVEDEPEICTLLRYNLEANGYRVTEAHDGDEAELLLKEQPPDLLLLDWMLPEMSGIELLRRLRRWPSTQALPVIVVTARSEAADRVRAFETGADDLVIKPFSVSGEAYIASDALQAGVVAFLGTTATHAADTHACRMDRRHRSSTGGIDDGQGVLSQ